MYFITDIQYNSTPHYIDYLVQKTNFLIDYKRENSIFYLFLYIMQKINFQKIYSCLSNSEKYSLEKLMDNFGVLKKENITVIDKTLEKKYDWVLFHPNGNLFIPMEFILEFTADKSFFEKNYLIHLLDNMPKEEKKYWASILSKNFYSFSNLTIGKYPIDIFIIAFLNLNYWNQSDTKTQSNEHNNQNIIYTFYKSSFPTFGNLKKMEQDFKEYTIKTPIPLHIFVKKYFNNSYLKYKKCKFLFEKCKKNFYRSLQIAFSDAEDHNFLSYFFHGMWIPIFPKNKKQKKNFDSIKIITPREYWKNSSL